MRFLPYALNLGFLRMLPLMQPCLCCRFLITNSIDRKDRAAAWRRGCALAFGRRPDDRIMPDPVSGEAGMDPTRSFYFGNATVDQVRDSGWFVGQFVPAELGLRHQNDVEVKWG